MRSLCLPALLFAFAHTAGAAELHAALDLVPQWQEPPSAGPIAQSNPGGASLRADLELRYREGGLNAQGILRGEAARGQSSDLTGILNQFYYDGGLSGGNGYTLGKKVLSWGVGFGFRPLDVIQRENRRELAPPPLEGVPVLAWRHDTADRSLSMVWSNPGTGSAGQDDNGRNNGGQAVSALGYALAGDHDLYAVLSLSRLRHVEAGVGWARTLGDEWAFHASALYQAHTPRGTAMAAAGTGPVAKALAGAQWTGESGFGVLLEVWYDGEAPTKSDWRRLNALAAAPMPPPAVAAIQQGYAEITASPDVLRGNVLLRLSYRSDPWDTSLECLATPADGGTATTFRTAWQGDRLRLSFGARLLGGAAGSVYADSPQRRMGFVEARYAWK